MDITKNIESMNTIESIKKLSFEQFLWQVYQRFPEETLMMLGSADASPESGPAKRNSDSYAIELLKDKKDFAITDTREFDRATLGLKAFYEIITDNDDWAISASLTKHIKDWVKPQVQTKYDIEAWIYAILFNDLGKLHSSNEEHKKLYNNYCADHDINMVDILKANPSFYPNFVSLDKKYQQSLIVGLSSGFNLGKAVQLESPNSSWNDFLNLSSFDQDFHMGHCLFDFMGISGANNPRQYADFVMNDQLINAFISTIELHDHHIYGMARLKQVGLDENLENAFGISRLIAMASIFDIKQKDKLISSLNVLPENIKNNVFKELNKPGSIENPAIELQYLPSILKNTINNKDEEIFTKALIMMSNLFTKARENIDFNSAKNNQALEIYTFNLIDLATEIRNDALVSIDSVNNNIADLAMKQMDGGWKWEKTDTNLSTNNKLKR